VASFTSSAVPQLGHSTPRAFMALTDPSALSAMPVIASALKATERPTDQRGFAGSP
jgi:hypothetical protein